MLAVKKSAGVSFYLGREEKPHHRCKPILRPPSEPIPCPRKGCFRPRWSQVCRIGVTWERKLGLCQYTSVPSWAGEGRLGPGGHGTLLDGRSVLRESHAPSWLWGCRAVTGPSRTEAYMLSTESSSLEMVWGPSERVPGSGWPDALHRRNLQGSWAALPLSSSWRDGVERWLLAGAWWRASMSRLLKPAREMSWKC